MHVALESWGVHAQLSLPVNTASFRGWSGSLSNNSSLGDDAPQTAPSSVQPFCVAHGCDQQTDRHIYHVTSAALGRIV